MHPFDPSQPRYDKRYHRYSNAPCYCCPSKDDEISVNIKEIEPPDYNTAMALNRRIDSFQGELAFTRNKINSILDKRKRKETIIIEGGEGTIH